MCGIAGVYRLSGESIASSDLITRIAHRGPDNRGTYNDGVVDLVSTRLAIIDLAGGNQPLFNHDRTLVLVANGEIYNHLELRAGLEQRGHRFTSNSDCEVLLHAYAEHGPEFLVRIHGMFAFALFDKNKRQLLLARDRLGIKPLFFINHPRRMAFASELKALLPLLGRQPRVHGPALAQCLQSNFSTGRTTIVADIERLQPAEAMIIGEKGLEKRWCYWAPEEVEPEDRSFDEAAEEFEPLLREVIDHHLRSDMPIGLFLSGGTDSAVLLALLSERMGARISTFSVGFPGTGVSNELPDAAWVARRFEADHHAFEMDLDELLGYLPIATWAADELMCDYANLPTLKLAQEAGSSFKVVFTGEGGDEVFAGYGRYRPSRWRCLRNFVLGVRPAHFRSRGMFRGRLNTRIFGGELLEHMKQWQTPFEHIWKECPAGWTNLQRMQLVDLRTWLADDLLTKVDRMLMTFGVEGRVPYLDHRIVQFGLGLPDRLKNDRRTGKLFLKHWATRHLPSEHLFARKRGFTVPVRDWLSSPRVGILGELLGRNRGIREWFNPLGVRELLSRYCGSGHGGQSLWVLLQFAMWHTLFIEGDGQRPPSQLDPLDMLAG